MAQNINEVMQQAQQAALTYRNTSPNDIATFLETIASEIENLGEPLVEAAMAEAHLPEGRIKASEDVLVDNCAYLPSTCGKVVGPTPS